MRTGLRFTAYVAVLTGLALYAPLCAAPYATRRAKKHKAGDRGRAGGTAGSTAGRDRAPEPNVWQSVPVIDVRNISKERFHEDYLSRGIPTIIEGLLDDWPAYRLWTKEYFMSDPDVSITRIHWVDMSDFDDHPMYNKAVRNGTLREFLERLDRGEKVQVFALGNTWTDFISCARAPTCEPAARRGHAVNNQRPWCFHVYYADAARAVEHVLDVAGPRAAGIIRSSSRTCASRA